MPEHPIEAFARQHISNQAHPLNKSVKKPKNIIWEDMFLPDPIVAIYAPGLNNYRAIKHDSDIIQIGDKINLLPEDNDIAQILSDIALDNPDKNIELHIQMHSHIMSIDNKNELFFSTNGKELDVFSFAADEWLETITADINTPVQLHLYVQDSCNLDNLCHFLPEHSTVTVHHVFNNLDIDINSSLNHIER